MRASRFCQTVALGLLLGGAQLAHANLLTNGSFEDPAPGVTLSLLKDSTLLTGWTVINAEIAQLYPGNLGITASNGQYSLDLTATHDAKPYGGVRQAITTVVGAEYKISFDVGARGNGNSKVQVLAGSLNGGQTVSANEPAWSTFNATFTAYGTSTNIDLIGIEAS